MRIPTCVELARAVTDTTLQANEHHRKHLESLPSTPYPLKPTGDPAEVVLRSTPSLHGHIDGTSPHLVGEMESQSVDGKPFHQR